MTFSLFWSPSPVITILYCYTKLLLDEIYPLSGISIWFNGNRIVIVDFTVDVINLSQKIGDFELVPTIYLVLQTQQLTKWSSLPENIFPQKFLSTFCNFNGFSSYFFERSVPTPKYWPLLACVVFKI